jgi:hypothetical protein
MVRRMKVLFITWHFGCLRNYERAIVQLAGRGHRVHLVALSPDALGGEALVTRLATAHPAITWERRTDASKADSAQDVRARLRLMTDYLRYLQPAYSSTPKLVERARTRTPRGFLRLVRLPGMRGPTSRRLLRSVLRTLERASPPREDVAAYLRGQNPDVVLLTPLIGLGSEEPDYLDASVRLGVRTVYCVWSWDNLSSKTLLRTVPDAVTVWNETQAREAAELHGVPRERVVVTGAQSFDQWFGREPSFAREAFCQRVGLPADRPFLLWVCSAVFKHSPVEAAFVRRWIEAIRRSPLAALRDGPILVRPHPSRMTEWKDVPLDDLGPVAFWGANPIDPESQSDYFDSLYHAAAVVGLNTSAFLEAAVVGRPVFTILLPEYFDSQEGTLHFPYLLNVAGGLLHAQRTMEGHLVDLDGVLRAPDGHVERSRRFVAEFIRPHGLDVSATDRFVAAVEAVGARDRAPAPAGAWLPAMLRLPLRAALAGLASRAMRPAMLSPTEWEEEAAREARLAQHRAEKERHRHARAAAKAEGLRRKEAVLEEHRAAKRAAKQSAARSGSVPGSSGDTHASVTSRSADP